MQYWDNETGWRWHAVSDGSWGRGVLGGEVGGSTFIVVEGAVLSWWCT